jgi:lysozyme family protein
VPWFVTGIVLTREAGSPPNFHAWLHNGDPMFDRLLH